MIGTKLLAWKDSGSSRARRGRSVWPVAALALALCGYAAGVSANDGSQQGQAEPVNARVGKGTSMAAEYFTDTTLVDQHGKGVRFYSDLLEGRVVIINTFYTDCEGEECPTTMDKLQAIQGWLGDRLGSEAHILSISVDPENDTPQRLREYAERFRARAGWYFLTGVPENVAFVLAKLGQQRVDIPTMHENILIVGNEPTGLWKKARGMAPPAELIEVVDSVLRDGV